jgi:hypothetical protein
VTATFERLSASAAALNAVSDELSKPIATIDAALKALNLGVSAWVEIAGQVDHDAGCFWDRSLGYAKVAGKWGIAICTSSGDFGEEPNEEVWLFSDAPRSYRLEAVDKLPELLEKLVTAANETAEKLKEKVTTTGEIANAIANTPTALKEALLAAIRREKVVFYNTVVAQAKSIEIGDRDLVFHFLASQPKLVALVEQQSRWLEELVLRVCGRQIAVSVSIIHDSPKK